MAEMIFTRKYAAGEVIFRAGEMGRDAYLIERGRVRVTLPRTTTHSGQAGGDEVVIAELGPGEIFGEMSMIDDAPRSATVTAVEDTEAIVILRARFLRPLQTGNPLMNLVMRVVLSRFRNAQFRLVGATGGPSGSSLEEIRALALDRLQHEKAMRHGLEADEFEMHYQPIIDLATGRIAGFESLMRWRRGGPGGEMVSPGLFIPLAEETGLIVDLGRLALRHGLRDRNRFARAFAEAGQDQAEPFISVNVSGLQLAELDEIGEIAAIISQSETDPAVVKLEITETLMVQNIAHATEALKQLKGLGLSIAIDDFGTGYSSLSYLHQLPLDTLKIDRAFITNMDKSDNSRRVVHSVVQLAHALGIEMVAEGIEEPVQLAALRDLGCHYGQGYHMSRPLPVDAVLELIASRPHW
ncbi:MAG: EAL domain-containing protein [Hyphomicrobiales bacterium]|nr:EAL domain-containing protein [Hyphomicrobiales bacterium]